MTILIKEQILKRLREKDLVFSPNLDSFQLQAHSVDLRLGYTFLIPKNAKVGDSGRRSVKLDSSKSRDHFEVIELERGQHFDILPGEYLIVSTLEQIKLPNDVMAVLYPRSSVNRRGLSVDLSGIIDAGYEGNLIVPVRNNTSSQVITVYPGERFCQLVFHQLPKPVKVRKSRYAKKDIVVGLLKEKHLLEAKLVRDGKIKELKKDYALSLDEE